MDSQSLPTKREKEEKTEGWRRMIYKDEIRYEAQSFLN